jgi:hypothetical protein
MHPSNIIASTQPNLSAPSHGTTAECGPLSATAGPAVLLFLRAAIPANNSASRAFKKERRLRVWHLRARVLAVAFRSITNLVHVMNRHLALVALFTSLLVHAGHAEELRMWTDSTSGNTIEASYVSADPVTRTVTIAKKDGQQFTIPVARLNQADIDYIRTKLQAPAPAPGTPPAAPATPTPGAPAAPATPAGKPAVVTGPPAPPKPDFKIIPAKSFKGPSGSDFVRAVQRVRPRMLHTAQTWAGLKARAAEDTVLTALLASVRKGGEDLLTKPELNKIFGTEKARGNAEGAQAMCRMATLGTLHFIDGDPKWQERAIRELDMLCDSRSFPDWSPAEPELCADFTTAVVMGYDWFKGGMNAAVQKKVLTYLVQKGVEPLAAHLKGDEMPATATTVAPGTSGKSDTKKGPAKGKPEKRKGPPTKEEFIAASALIMAAICLVDDDPAAAKKSGEAVSDIFTDGILAFAPGGIWPEGMEAGDEVLDAAAMVMQTLRVSGGGDFNLGYVEGMPNAGPARLHLTGPRGMFNYGDAGSGNLAHAWVSTWLAGLHGNPGMKAATATAPGANSAFFQAAGHVIYYNPWAGGNGTAESTDAVFPGAEVAALRSAWNDPKAYYIALKGGDNENPATQLDLGSFVLDAGGVRWGVELGAEGDRVRDYEPNPAARDKRHTYYLASTKGQNTLTIGADEAPEKKDDDDAKKKAAGGKAPPAPPTPGNQPMDSKAAFIGFNSTPERGAAIVDLSDAYSTKAKQVHRGAMVSRGATPYILLQDDIEIKGTSTIEWRMHTQATISTSGNKATLTSGDASKGGGQTLTATILSPAGASFSTEEPPAKANEQARDLKNYHVLKVKLPDVKGEQRIAIAFALGSESPTAPVVPLTQWVAKK